MSMYRKWSGVSDVLGVLMIGVHARVLLQKKESKIVITDENVKDFVKLVEDAKNGTDVVIAVPSIHLSKPLEIKTSITLRGQDPEKRPRIDCKRDEAWITVRYAMDVKIAPIHLLGAAAWLQSIVLRVVKLYAVCVVQLM